MSRRGNRKRGAMSRNSVDHILFGAAYYDEYLMMKGIVIVMRI